MTSTLYKFFAPHQLHWLKKSLIALCPAVNSPLPFDHDIAQFFPDVTGSLTEDEYLQLMREKYEHLPDQAKQLVDFNYFLEKSADKRHTIEKMAGAQKTNNPVARAGQYKTVGYMSLTGDLTTVRHWHHYADQHRGYAIEFDTIHDYFSAPSYKDNPQLLRPIIYSDLRPLQTDEVLFPAVFHKPVVYKDEKELRLARPLVVADKTFVDNSGQKRYYCKLPLRSIRSITVGCRMSTAIRNELVHFVKHEMALKPTVLRECRLDPDAYQLHFVDIP